MTVPFMYNFRRLSDKFPTVFFFVCFNFSHFTLHVRLFFVEKRKPKIFGFKNVMERGISELITLVIVKLHLKFSGK